MTIRPVRWIFFLVLAVTASHSSWAYPEPRKQASDSWDINACAITLSDWTKDFLLSTRLDIRARIMSVRDDGCFLDVGTEHYVTVGQVFEIYRAPHNGGAEEIAGQVQVAWTREDYCFCEPRAGLVMTEISTLHFARLVHLPPVLALLSDISEGGGAPELDRLLQTTYMRISPRSIRPVLGEPDEPAWRLVITPDLTGLTIRASLSDPGGEVIGSIMLNPRDGTRIAGDSLLDPSYLAGIATPYEHFLAPPGRRAARIAVGNIVPGAGDELAVLDGADLWIYDLSGAEARLLSSFSVSIPPGPVRHREDAGSLELIDLDGNGLAEVCLSPPGAVRGEVWRLEADMWVLLGYLPHPARAVWEPNGAVLIGQCLLNSPSLDPASVSWFYPLTGKEPDSVSLGFQPTGITALDGNAGGGPVLLATDLNGNLFRIPPSGDPVALPGEWGTCIKVAGDIGGPVALVTSPRFRSDVLYIISPVNGDIYAEFPLPSGPIIDIAIGDIDRDHRAEIVVAALEEEGVRIYY